MIIGKVIFLQNLKMEPNFFFSFLALKKINLKIKITFPGNIRLTYFIDYGFSIGYVSNFDGCGGILTSYTGNVYPTGYPKAYPQDLNCEWQIFSPAKDQTIILEFVELNVFYDIDCEEYCICYEDENLSIYQGSENDPTER